MRTKFWIVVLAVIVLAGSSFGGDKGGGQKKVVELKNIKGESVGTVSLTPAKDGVAVLLNLKNLPPGEHALHFHQTAKCEADPAKPADAFKSAGGHFNPESKKHGLENPEGPHAGDMANFTVKPDGTVKSKVVNSRVALEEGKPNSVYGTAVMVHAKADDMKTDPAGNAGERIACGVVEK